MERIWRSLLAVCLALPMSGLVLAQEEEEAEDPMAELKEEIVQEVLEILHDELEERGLAEDEPEPLGKAVNLEFKVLPAEGQNVLSVTCAAREFRVAAHFGNEEGGAHFEVVGRLTPMEKGAKLLVAYEAVLELEGGGGERGFEAEGSVITEVGETATLARLGDRIVTVTVKEAGKKEF